MQKVNEQASVINSYEAGKAVPSNQVLAKLERQLGVKLRYADMHFTHSQLNGCILTRI